MRIPIGDFTDATLMTIMTMMTMMTMMITFSENVFSENVFSGSVFSKSVFSESVFSECWQITELVCLKSTVYIPVIVVSSLMVVLCLTSSGF